MSGNRKTSREKEEVEELLRAAEDEMMLKLSIDSHMSRVSPSYIDPDLDHRFQSLRRRGTNSKTPTNSSVNNSNPNSFPSISMNESRIDDLLGRFTALKASISIPSSSITTNSENQFSENRKSEIDELVRRGGDGGGAEKQKAKGGNNDEIDEDEVQKLINWAVDAARLDPSPPSDSDSDDTSDDDAVVYKKKGN